MQEKRKNTREKTLWKVNIVEENTEHFIGYLMDISEGGTKFYIDREKAKSLKKVFMVKIKPPYELDIENRTLKVEKVWDRESHFIEMGLRFVDISEEDAGFVRYLLVEFLKDRNINVETQILP